MGELPDLQAICFQKKLLARNNSTGNSRKRQASVDSPLPQCQPVLLLTEDKTLTPADARGFPDVLAPRSGQERPAWALLGAVYLPSIHLEISPLGGRDGDARAHLTSLKCHLSGTRRHN